MKFRTKHSSTVTALSFGVCACMLIVTHFMTSFYFAPCRRQVQKALAASGVSLLFTAIVSCLAFTKIEDMMRGDNSLVIPVRGHHLILPSQDPQRWNRATAWGCRFWGQPLHCCLRSRLLNHCIRGATNHCTFRSDVYCYQRGVAYHLFDTMVEGHCVRYGYN